ncbi:EI24 domain-containing protein [Nocardioides panacisoli]|uniref:EI24 domain-containing protein n=1 Tax=Nocardioides panacisoli TaxID=627624 RepID=UPI001C62F7C4|nr:EI24 domain-containing protein [Nocardioides panacisoli]QYJ04613.1 EI24 domain-containing protein [Nocardioides panacisoli]
MGAGDGVACFLRGVAEWRAHPRRMLGGILPALLVLLVLAAAFVVLLVRIDDLVGWATPFADGWVDTARQALRVALGLVVVLGAGVLAVVSFTAITLTVGDPVYERIWRATETDLGGPVPDAGPGWWRSVADGLVLVLLGLATTVVVFVVGLVPLVGTVAGPVIGVLLAGRLVARELLSRPLGARGLDRREQGALLADHRGATLGFGAAVQLCFLVPFGAVLMMPAAVAGATMLAREVLDRSAAGAVQRPDSV